MLGNSESAAMTAKVTKLWPMTVKLFDSTLPILKDFAEAEFDRHEFPQKKLARLKQQLCLPSRPYPARERLNSRLPQ